MTSRPSIRKREYIVDPKVQWTLILYSLGVAVIVALLCVMLIQSDFYYLLTGLFSGVLDSNSRMLVLLILGGIFVVVFSIIFLGITLSNRIAGPIYRLIRHMEGVRDGVVTEDLVLRKGDYFAKSAKVCNEMVKAIRASK